MENSMTLPQKTKNTVTMWSSNLTPGHIPSKTIIQKDTHTSLFIASLFTTAKTRKQPKYPLTGVWGAFKWPLPGHHPRLNQSLRIGKYCSKRFRIKLDTWKSSRTVSVLRWFNSVTKECKWLPFLTGSLRSALYVPGTAQCSVHVVIVTLGGSSFYVPFMDVESGDSLVCQCHTRH